MSDCRCDRNSDVLLAILVVALFPPALLIAMVGVWFEDWQDRRAARNERPYAPSERVTFRTHHARPL